MDVYMPRDRMNRAEHRGFGFVTFETEAAILRVASYGGHMIRFTCCSGPSLSKFIDLFIPTWLANHHIQVKQQDSCDRFGIPAVVTE